ncbi:MAG TPA: hypothetical protein VLS89_13910 [Candidatus Nanopelagicales bacterium]|nr:hypothetical protein [Candidatus Nanopelagicales bacterium]
MGYDLFQPRPDSSPPPDPQPEASPGEPAAPPVTAVQVSIVPRGDTLLGTIVYIDPEGRPTDQREFTVPGSPCACWSLVTYLAVAIAFAMSPFPLPEATPDAPLPCPEPRPCPQASVCPIPRRLPEPARPRPAPGREPPARPEVQVGGGWQVGLGLGLPAAAIGGFGQVRLRWPVLSLALGGRAQAPEPTEGVRGAPAEVGLYAGDAAGCVHEGVLFACLSGELGALHVRGPTVNDHFTFLGLGLRGGLDLPLGDRFVLELRTEILGNFMPVRVAIDETSRDEWLISPLSGSAGAGVLARF